MARRKGGKSRSAAMGSAKIRPMLARSSTFSLIRGRTCAACPSTTWRASSKVRIEGGWGSAAMPLMIRYLVVSRQRRQSLVVSRWQEATTALLRQFLPQHSGIAGKRDSRFKIDKPVADQLGNFTVEILHAISFAVLDGLQQGLAFLLALFDTFPGSSVRLQPFKDRQPSGAVGARD